MNIQELKTKLEEKTFKIEDLNIKTYLPLLYKKVIVDNIISDVVSTDENGLSFVDNIQKKITVTLSVLINYCGVEIEEDNTEDIFGVLDLLFENGFYEEIQEKIGDDVYDLLWLIDDEIRNLQYRNNSLESVVAKGLNKFIDVVNKNTSPKEIKSFIKEFGKQFKDFDPQKMEQIKSMMQFTNK